MSFSDSSQAKLSTCAPSLQLLFTEIEKYYPCVIIDGFRTKERQDEAFRTGKSKFEWPKGKHNSEPSRAVDAAPLPIDWNDKQAFYHFAGYVRGMAHALGIQVRWGGDWDGDMNLKNQTFFDLVHFELI